MIQVLLRQLARDRIADAGRSIGASRRAIEQQYQNLKTELGLDHFEGRTFPGWHHHVVLTAITYHFLQAERYRTRTSLTSPVVRGILQEIFTACLFAQRPQYQKRIDALRSVQLRI